MRVDVYDRGGAEGLEPRPDTVVISISTPGQRPARLKEGWEDVLRLEFHDVVRPMEGAPELVLFGPYHVEQVLAFTKGHREKDFVIHCDAGASRSVAVGLYLQDYYEAELHLHAIHTTAAANGRVHRGLMRDHWRKRLRNERES